MHRGLRFGLAPLLGLFLVGCGGSGEATPAASGGATPAGQKAAGAGVAAAEPDVEADPPTTVKGPGPNKVVHAFLEAVRTGNHAGANDLLTKKALEETQKSEMVVAPMGSDTATFKVGEVELLAKDGDAAHVASTWTDVDETGRPRTDSIVWMLRLEAEGWRIAGMATVVFEGEPPLVLNFEDHKEMERKQRLTEAEIQKRATASQAAQTSKSTGKSNKGKSVKTKTARQKDKLTGKPTKGPSTAKAPTKSKVR